MSPTLILLTLSLTGICGNHCSGPTHNFRGLQTRQSELWRFRGVTSCDSPLSVNIHSAPGKAGWGSHQWQHVFVVQPGLLSAVLEGTIRAGTECGSVHQRRTLEQLVDQKHIKHVQLIQLSTGKYASISRWWHAVLLKITLCKVGLSSYSSKVTL